MSAYSEITNVLKKKIQATPSEISLKPEDFTSKVAKDFLSSTLEVEELLVRNPKQSTETKGRVYSIKGSCEFKKLPNMEMTLTVSGEKDYTKVSIRCDYKQSVVIQEGEGGKNA